jgi:hypothetical protein
MDLAEDVAGDAADWRRDSIRVKVAQAYVWLGNDARATALEAGIGDGETGKVDSVRAKLMDEARFDEQLVELDGLVASGNLDLTRNALATYAQLYDRFYAAAERRSAIDERLVTAWDAVPVLLRLEHMGDVTEIVLAHGDRAKALELVNEMQRVMESVQWTVEYLVPVRARIAALRHRAGDEARARVDNREMVIDIYRAGALRPLAEAYKSMGDTSAAVAIYKKAVEESVVNPNARPRAEDLCATCCSMALHGVEPDAELWSRIREVRRGLGDPS